MHRHIYCKKVKDSIKCCAGNAEQSGISVGEKGSPDTKPYLNNCKQNNQNGGCDIREAQIFPEWVKGKEHKWKEVKKCKYAYFDDISGIVTDEFPDDTIVSTLERAGVKLF